MAIDGWYYLHTGGELIWKRNLGPSSMPQVDSDFVRRIWPMDLSDRAHAWFMVIEASALGVRPGRIKELVDKWGLTNEDALLFAENTGQFKILQSGDKWVAGFGDFVSPEESDCGVGDTALESLVELAKPMLLEREKNGTLEKVCPLGE